MGDELQSHKDLILRFCVRVSEGKSFTEYDAEESTETAIERLYHLVHCAIKRAATGPLRQRPFLPARPAIGRSTSHASAALRAPARVPLMHH